MGATSSANELTEQTDPLCIADETAADLLRDAPWRRVAIVGDSTAEGVGEPYPGYRTIAWPDRLMAALHTAVGEVAYLNTGKMGATSRQVLDHQLEPVLTFEPDLALIGCGGNDLWVARPDYAATEDNLDRLFSAITGTGARTLTSTLDDDIKDPQLQPFRVRLQTFNDIIRRIADRYDAILLDLDGHPIRQRTNLVSSDNIHYTMAGHAVVATEIIKTLATAIPRSQG
ncbi:SGNH/GDSL hydrolase family protein [Nocardia sp. bgisy134]|uniref:SGNH/GDSL hydrolase family protein n=1 Tax=Nocardia sp. bgisy134 TaxID=3413789 RepID=UPI003D754E88